MEETAVLGEEKIRELADREEIKEVRNRFALALDTRDWELFDSLFADDVDADLPDLGVPRGTVPKAELLNAFSRAFRRPASEMGTQQLYGNFIIEVRGDEATSSSYFVGHHNIPGFEGGEDATLRARYVDRLVRTENGWKIAALTVHVFSIVGNPLVFA
jgi:ketosteroid isomerase-like protein